MISLFLTQTNHTLDSLKLMMSAKEMLNDHNHKERFAAASPWFATGDLNFTLPEQTTVF